MAIQRMSFKRWHAQTGQPVPLDLVPQLLQVSPAKVRRAVAAGELRVLTFRADNGKVYRMVPRADLHLYGKNPLTIKRLAIAMQKLIAA